jgi:hypothetical protein
MLHDTDVAGKTKGIGFISLRTFVLERFGLDGWTDVLAELSAEDRAELDGIVTVGWYSLALNARVLRAVDKVRGTGDLELVFEHGKYQAERDLTTVHRALLRIASPSFFLEQSAEVWRRFHDSGAWTIERLGTGRVRAYLDGWAHVDAALCREMSGYLLRVFELVGARSPQLEHPQCRSLGAPRCLFLGNWVEGGTKASR